MSLQTSFFTALASSAWMLATACGGATSVSAEDGGAKEAGWDGTPSTPCSGGAVTFAMRTAEGSTASYCFGHGCSLAWLDVTTDRAEIVAYGLGCQLSCVDCRSGGCNPICFAPQPLTPQGEQLIWDGRVWGPSTCGAQQSCAAPACASPGKYVAKMCATAINPGDAGSCRESMNSPQTCVEVEFEYPTAAMVAGVLP